MWRPGAGRKTVAARFGTLGRPDASTRRRGRPTEAAEATSQPQCGNWAQNRQGGAPRGAVPVARDGPRFANVVSRCYGTRRTKDTASRRSAIPSVGDRKLRRKEEPGGTNLPGTKKREIRIS